MRRVFTTLLAGAMVLGVSSALAGAAPLGFRDDFSSFDEARWEAGDHALGRSYLHPRNVGASDGALRLKLPSGTTDGAEIVSHTRHGYGSYEARIKVPMAPSSITGFFLYYPPDFASEIDIEVFNDDSRRVMFTYYSDGKTVTKNARLPFDPTADFHTYRFDYEPNRLRFYVDGELMTTLRGNLPRTPMRLYVNAWYPAWLAGQPATGDRYALVDWIRHVPSR